MIFESASNEELVTDNRNHSFPVAVAIRYSSTIALWLHHLAYWTEHNLSLNKNIYDGLCWSYTTLEALGDQFPYLSKSQRETMINNSIKEGLVIKGNYNKTKYDRTIWYALTPKAYAFFAHLLIDKYLQRLYLSISQKSEMDFIEFGNRFPGNRTPIPYTLPDTKKSIINSKPKSDEVVRELIEVYREEFPNNPQPHKTLISTSLEKVMRTLVKRWPEADPEKRPISTQAFRKYLIYLKQSSPQFALGEYETPDGKRKKNGLETFARWNTLVKCLEGAYS